MLMRLIVIIYDGYIAEGHVVLSTWSSVIDVRCTDAETIYLRIPQHPHPSSSASSPYTTQPLGVPSHLGRPFSIRIRRPRPANSAQRSSATIIINIIYNINPAYCNGWQVCVPSSKQMMLMVPMLMSGWSSLPSGCTQLMP